MLLVEQYLVMLELGLGYRTTFFALALLHLLPVLSHISTQRKAHPSQNGSMRMDVIVSNAGKSQSDAFAPYLARSASGPGPPLPFHTASNATRTRPTTMKMIALCGRSVIGVSPLTMHIMTAQLLIMDAS
jgi:hypothetical protein